MRILNIEGGYFVRPLRDLGHEVLTVGTARGCDVLLDRPLSPDGLARLLDSRGFRPDVAIWADMCRVPCVVGLESLPCLTVCFSIDQYMNPWHAAYAAAFDLVLVAQRDYLPLFDRQRIPRAIEWFPLFCDSARCPEPAPERDVPVSFVGTLAGPANRERKGFLDAFRRLHPLLLHQGEFGPVYARSRLVLNQSAAGELNFRIFEAAACGAAVLTEDVANGLRDIFSPGENILVYSRGDAASAAAAARAALADPGGLARIAEAGQRAVLAGHTAEARTRQLLRRARELMRDGAPLRRLAHRDAILDELSRAYAILGTDEALPLPDGLRRFFVELGLAYGAGL